MTHKRFYLFFEKDMFAGAHRRRNRNGLRKKRSHSNHRFLIICIITLVSLLALNGCMFFGGGGEEAAQTTETSPEETAATPAPQKLPIDESRFQEGEYDVIQTIESTGPDGQIIPAGTLNWSNGVVNAVGFGRGTDEFSAITAARVVAEANLLGMLKGVQIDSTTTVENAILGKQIIERKIQGVLKGATVIDQKFDAAEQMAKVVVATGLESVADVLPDRFRECPQAPSDFEPRLSNAFYTFEKIDPENNYIPDEVILRGDLEEVQHLLEKSKQKDETVRKLLAELEALEEAKETQKTEEAYTGLIINASGLDVKQVLFPRIYYRDGDGFDTQATQPKDYKLLYGDETANRPGEAVEIWAAWTQTLNDAKAHNLVKENPLVVQAIGVSGSGDSVISAEAAEKIESLEKEYHFLQQGKVVIVL